MQIIIFEDSHVEKLFPVTLTRPAFLISCGGYTLLERLNALELPIRTSVRPYLRGHEPVDRVLQEPPTDEARTIPTLFVNGRVVPSAENLTILRNVVLGNSAQSDRPSFIRSSDSISAAVFPRGLVNHSTVIDPPKALTIELEQIISTDPCDEVPHQLSLIEYPHEIVRYHSLIFGENVQSRIQVGQYDERQDGVFIHPEVEPLDCHVVFDTQCGPILIDEGVKIRPFCFLRGPLHLSRHVRVNAHSSIKDNVFIGVGSKVGGEIEETTFESQSNKQHQGFLGHAYVGSWVNLGAGTCNSDLKNTYGEIRMEYVGHRVPTGMQFMGCVIGDYTKSAINTSIFTGKTIGACSMLYGYVTQNVPSFVNYAQSFGQTTELPPKVILEMQKRMFARRGLKQTQADIELIECIYDLVSSGRELAEEPPVL